MERLIHAHLLSTRKREARAAAPAFLRDRRTRYAALRQLRNLRIHVVAHQIQDGSEHRLAEFAHAERLGGWMNGSFRRRERKNQPAAPDVNRWKCKRVAQE